MFGNPTGEVAALLAAGVELAEAPRLNNRRRDLSTERPVIGLLVSDSQASWFGLPLETRGS